MPLRNSLLALVMLLLTVSGPVAASTGAATLDDKEASQLVRATIMLSDTGAASLFAADVKVVGRLDRLGLLTVEATPERLAELKASGAIEGYSVARPLHLFLDESTIAVKANLVNVQGHTGAGAAVVVIDSGVDRNHPAFGDRIVAEACFLDTINGICPSSGGARTAVGPGAAQPCPAADCYHGTHVAGIVGSSDDAVPGVAPGVDLVAVRVADNSGAIMSSDVLDALNWVLTVAETHNIVAVNLSLGTDVPDNVFFARAVAWMADNEITTGASPTTFSSDDLVNRAQAITSIWRLVNTAGAWGSGVELPETVTF